MKRHETNNNGKIAGEAAGFGDRALGAIVAE